MRDDPQIDVSLLCSLLGEHVFVAASTISSGLEDLLPEESPAVFRAVPKRQREFATGRVLARSLLTGFGYDGPLIRGKDNVPDWPAGVMGSITHSDHICVVAVTAQTKIASIGIDVEPVTPLAKNLWPRICTPHELEWIGAEAGARQGLLAKVIFCSKEAVYKCQYGVTQRFLDFHAVEITPASEHFSLAGKFLAKVSYPASEVGLEGFVTVFEGHFVAGVVLKAGEVPEELKRSSKTNGSEVP